MLRIGNHVAKIDTTSPFTEKMNLIGQVFELVDKKMFTILRLNFC